jgi:hypothetical protein
MTEWTKTNSVWTVAFTIDNAYEQDFIWHKIEHEAKSLDPRQEVIEMVEIEVMHSLMAAYEIPALVWSYPKIEPELAAIQKRLAWLDALEAAGVDNWEGYSHAHEIYLENGGTEE